MDVINSVMTGVLVRIDDALFALLAVLFVQISMMVFSLTTKRAVPPMPWLEICVRPVAVFLTDKLNRDHRSDFSRIIRGAIALTGIGMVAFCIGIALEYLCVRLGIGAWMDVVLLVPILSPLLAVTVALQISKEKPDENFYHYAAISLNQNLIATDIAGQRRNGYRLLVLSVMEWCIAPLFFYLLGGAPLAYSYVVLSVFCRVSSKGGEAHAFLSVFEPLLRGMNGIVSVIGVLFVAAGSVFSTGGHPLRVLKAWRYLATGLAMQAAYAYAQNIILGGAIQDRTGQGIKQKWLGQENATAKLTHEDMIKGCVMHAIIIFVVLVVLLGLYTYL